MDWPSLIVGVVSGGVAAAAVTWAVMRSRLTRELASQAQQHDAMHHELQGRTLAAERRAEDEQKRHDELASSHAALQAEWAQRGAELAEARALLASERQQGVDKLAVLQDAQAGLKEQFRLLATEVLDKSAKTLRDSHSERLEHMLTPLKERIGRFETQVRETYDRETRDRVALRTELKKLSELGLQMSSDAINLTKALKGESKTRGDWGELVLETLLERSGLERDREYETQPSFTSNEGGRVRPDVVIRLPEDRCLVIDSKVSLTAWTNYCDAGDELTQASAAKALVASMRTHVRDLGSKEYHDLAGGSSPDFVLMFVPIEPAFALACQQDPQLFQAAFDQHVVIVSPTTLLATLRTVANIWRYERQSRNALEIARVAGAMYDKFANFVGDLDQIGDRIKQTQQAHDAAVNKLRSGRGNLVTSAEKIRKLGAKAAKKLGIDWLGDAADPDAIDSDDDDSDASDDEDVN
ncbi:MAG: DNA recombination protein RmuC [Planctomycetota bacterium]|nr:DNA recombination protein RmuC [Planctomycetota bacterium]